MKYNDFQMLLYVDSSHFEACKAFYQYVLGLTAFYHWDEGIEDRGIKFHAGGGVIVLLCQDNPFPEYGPIHFQLEVNDIQSVYSLFSFFVRTFFNMETNSSMPPVLISSWLKAQKFL